jgi:hypothetical protein
MPARLALNLARQQLYTTFAAGTVPRARRVNGHVRPPRRVKKRFARQSAGMNLAAAFKHESHITFAVSHVVPQSRRLNKRGVTRSSFLLIQL